MAVIEGARLRGELLAAAPAFPGGQRPPSGVCLCAQNGPDELEVVGCLTPTASVTSDANSRGVGGWNQITRVIIFGKIAI